MAKQYETKPNTGALFKNTNKTEPDDRDYNGTIKVEGTEYWISGWVKKSAAGNTYMSLALKPKVAPQPKAEQHDDMTDDRPW